jgi:hypothetical protein
MVKAPIHLLMAMSTSVSIIMELLKVLVSTLGRMVTHILVPLRTVKSKVKEFGGKLLKRTAISMRVVMWMI